MLTVSKCNLNFLIIYNNITLWILDQATLHFTLGNVYATVMQFNNSADSYQRAVEIRPKYQAAKGIRLLLEIINLNYICIFLIWFGS